MIKNTLMILLTLILSACAAPVLKSTITPEPDMRVDQAPRIIIKGFDFKQHYETGRETTYGPRGGVGYNISKIGGTIAQSIGVALGFRYDRTNYENYDDIGVLRNAVKDIVEANDLSRSVVTIKDKKELALKSKAGALIFEGRSSNDAVQGATPFWWGVYNFFDYATLLALIGVPVHYEKEATVVLGVYNADYERLGRFLGTARVSQRSYMLPTEVLEGKTLEYAYQDAINTAADNWNNVLKENNQ